MSVFPANYIGGTSLNSQVTSYDTLAERVKYQLGHPLVNIEISDQQLYSNITNAIEYFTKWAGYTEEYLVFDSKIYTRGAGIKVDTMVNTTPEMYTSFDTVSSTIFTTVSSTTVVPVTSQILGYALTSVHVPIGMIADPTLITGILNLDPDDTFQITLSTNSFGIPVSAIITYEYQTLVNTVTQVSSVMTTQVSSVSSTMINLPRWDIDLASYRKVVDCFSFNYGESTGINTLFTLEQAMSQQIYSSYMLGNFGFDLTTWEVLKGFIDTRTKVLAMTPHFRFDNRSQTLRIIPEPIPEQSYYGIVGCYIERPVKDIIRELWVHKYTLALTKISVANVRGKIKGTALFANGIVNADDFMQQGLKEKDELEKEIMSSYADNNPPMFFLGALAVLTVPAFLFAQSVANIFC